jgi:hypothetical protein
LLAISLTSCSCSFACFCCCLTAACICARFIFPGRALSNEATPLWLCSKRARVDSDEDDGAADDAVEAEGPPAPAPEPAVGGGEGRGMVRCSVRLQRKEAKQQQAGATAQRPQRRRLGHWPLDHATAERTLTQEPGRRREHNEARSCKQAQTTPQAEKRKAASKRQLRQTFGIHSATRKCNAGLTLTHILNGEVGYKGASFILENLENQSGYLISKF